MSDLHTPLQTVSSVKSRIVALENDGQQALIEFQSREGQHLIEAVQNQRNKSVERREETPSNSKSNGKEVESFRRGHKKVDSTAFLKQTYLSSLASNDLSDDAREILKSQPGEEDLLAVLQYLQCGIEKKHDFNIRVPGAKASQITNALVNVTVVDHWHRLKQKYLSQEDEELKRCLLSCLSSVTGIGALVSQIKKLSKPTVGVNIEPASREDMISTLECIFAPSSTIYDFIESTLSLTEKPAQRHAVWQELMSLLAGSKILTVVAQISGTCKVAGDEKISISWLGDGPKYCKWLSKNIAYAATTLLLKESEAWFMLAQITKRGFSLGNRDTFVSDIYSSLLLGHKASWTALHELLRALPRWEQKAFFDGMMRDIARSHLDSSMSSLSLSSSPIVQDRSIEAVAALVAGITENNKFLQDYIIEWLVDDNGANVSIGLPARRAVMATLSNHEEKLQKIMDRCLEILSDKLQIQHASILQQEATAQTMLLASGYLNRLDHNSIKTIARSSSYIHAVSNRLGSSIPRARYLGMIIGVAISRLVDEPGKIMDFGAEEMDSEQAHAWLDLVNIHDKVGNVEDIRKADKNAAHAVKKPTLPFEKTAKKPESNQSINSKIISIEEVEDSEPEDDNLVPYQKPDDDPSDSEDDPTLIDRSKPAAPVYILDLIKGLNDSDKPEVIQLALKAAPSLIRRKAGFGTEVSENIYRLASSLLNLSEGISKAQPQRAQLQALIACVVALPERMGLWLSSIYFEGDFSLVQRATLLVTIGLGCRELAGHTDDPALELPKESFPSKRLPDKFSAIYAPVDDIASSLSRATLQPMALAAADTLTGPDILKVRTFSSRLAVSQKAAEKSRERSMRIPKHLHKLLAESFYLPLCCRMKLVLSSRLQISRSTLFEPHIFKLFLQTLAILLNTLGPHASQLNTLTQETLLLLMQLHSTPALSLDPAILPPTLQLLLSILDLNIEAGTVAEERLVTDFGQTIAELMSWVGGLQDRKIPTQEGEGMPWTVVAAGCQVKWQEIGRKFQGRMFGLMGGDLDNF